MYCVNLQEDSLTDILMSFLSSLLVFHKATKNKFKYGYTS